MLENKVSIIGKDSVFSPVEKEELIYRFENIYTVLLKIENENIQDSLEYSLDPGIFLKNKDTFLTYSSKYLPGNYLQTDNTIFIRTKDERREMVAQIEGYLIVKNGIFSIYDPYKLSKNKVHLYYIFCPINFGHDALIKNFFKKASLPSRESSLRSFSSDLIQNSVESNTLDKITISRGSKPEYGTDDTLVIKKYPESKAKINQDGSIDYHTYSVFLEVKKGTVLAEKTEGQPGISGIDAYGENIHVPVPKRIAFSAGNNVEETKREDTIIVYTAGVTGILELKDSFVSVIEELHIKGNICADTGNISYSRQVIIDGDVEAPYKVECGDTLTIKGCIENGALIFCEGNVSVAKGIIGDKTNFLVKGNLETLFIQDAKIRVLGNLIVNNYIYNSQVFCGGELQVTGDKIKNMDKGAILGGSVTSMKKMTIHSAGSGFSRTSLSCGIDPELEKKLNELRESVPQLKAKILRMQNRIGLDLSQKNIKNVLMALPQSRKVKIKSLLEEIKNSASQKINVEKMIEKLKDKAINENTEELCIQISSHIIPGTEIIIGGLTQKVDVLEKSICITIENNHIIFKPL